MKIAKEYHGNRHVAVIYNGKRYVFITRRNSELLTEEISEYIMQKGTMLMTRYNGVNDLAFDLIAGKVIGMNEGEPLDTDPKSFLEKLLENSPGRKSNQKNI